MSGQGTVEVIQSDRDVGGIRQVRGKVTGKIARSFPKKIPNSIPIASQEHPRLIFRKSQLPQIQQKAKTKYGQIILDRPASRLLEQASIDAGIALAYDLCYNNCDRESFSKLSYILQEKLSPFSLIS